MFGAWAYESRAAYWSRFFPWELAWKLCGAPSGAEGLAHRYTSFGDDGGGGMVRHATYETAETWKRALATDRTLSVHGLPPAKDFIVFDYDMRDDGQAPPVCVRHGAHGARDLCAECWKARAVPAIAYIDRYVRQPLGLPATSLLPVFSGGNGVHVWMNLRRHMPPEQRAALAGTAAGRALLMDEWLGAAHAQQLRLLYGSDGTGGPTLKFDRGITVDAARHLIKLPFSLHDRTRLAAVPLLALDETPPHLARPKATIEEVLADHQRRVAALAAFF